MAHLLLTDLADPKTNISLEKNGLKPQFCIFYELVERSTYTLHSYLEY